MNRKYAALPDLDSAPDIYETPELTDDNSTVPPTVARTQSDDEFYDFEDDAQPISHSRLRINEARSRFLPASVDASGVDFSDRVDGKRKSYRASSRRQRILEDGTEEFGDLSDDDDEESLERKLARLRREVEEVKERYAKRKASTTAASTSDAVTPGDDQLESLSQALEGLSNSAGANAAASAPKVAQSRATAKDESENVLDDGPTYTVTYSPAYEQSHTLNRVADFDKRLLALERGLGIDVSSAPELGTNGLPRAILPNLDSLEKQISTLAQASTSSLDAVSRRVRALAQDQDNLNKSREKAKALREELGKHGHTPAPEESEQEAKINALYAILPTIESLTPVLPPLLDRLRSLRAIHAEAATASETLENIQRQQTEMAGELKQWREGLDKMENAIGEGDAAVKGNVKVMEGWIRLFAAMSSAPKPPPGHFNVLYFAGAGSHTGKEFEALPAPMALADLFRELEARYPGARAKILDSCMVTVNLEYVDVPGDGEGDGVVIQEADEVAIIPPVSSG
ncbi:Dynamitin subunit 2 [Paramyrothecium foliicola]|nr:Dynamitin subunit 2 [Paramyrothecium foliicola]